MPKLERSKSCLATLLQAGVVAGLAGGAAAANAAESRVATSLDAGIEEIIVTARKREEALIDVPVAVTAITGEQLELQGVRDVEGLYGRVPSLFFSVNRNFSSGKDNTFLVLRGVGANPALEPSVGIFIDGIYQPSLGFDTAFLDLERIELLRGPQGALFGRSTEGGALNIVTRKPGSEFRANAGIRTDNLASVTGNISLSGPVVDDELFAGLSVMGYGTEGYVHNRTTQESQNSDSGGSVRLAMRYQPSDATDVDFSADVTAKRGTELAQGVPLAFGKESYDVDTDFGGDFRSDQAGAGVTLVHRFDQAELTSLTGYRYAYSHRGQDFDNGGELLGNIQFIDTHQKMLSQEVRLASATDGAFSWLAGVYVYRQTDTNDLHTNWNTYFGDPANASLITEIERIGYSGFASLGYAAFGGFLDLAAGLRYTQENADASRYNLLSIPSFGLLIERRNSPDADSDDVSPNFQATLNWSDDFKTYVNVAKGFKSGGFEKYPTTGNPFLPLEPETAWNYEVGAKARSGRTTMALAVYRIEIENQHVPTLVPDPNTGFLGSAIASAGKAHTEGAELELTVMAFDGLTFSATGAYTEAVFDDFIDTQGQQRAGDPIPNVPKWIYNVGADYRREVSASTTFVANINMRHVDTYFSGIGTNADSLRPYPAYDIWDADVGLEFERMSVGLFVRNATDEYVITSQGFSFDRNDLVRQVGPPRTYGLRVAYRWGQ